jgi:hypothetical protein
MYVKGWFKQHSHMTTVNEDKSAGTNDNTEHTILTQNLISYK